MLVNPSSDIPLSERGTNVLCEFGFRACAEMYILKGHPKFKEAPKEATPYNINSSTMPMDFSEGFTPAKLFPYFDTYDHHGLMITYENKETGKIHWYVINLRAGAMLSTDFAWLGKQQGAIPTQSVLLDAPGMLPRCPKMTTGTNIWYRLLNFLHPASVDMSHPDYLLAKNIQLDMYSGEELKQLLVVYSCEMSNDRVDGKLKEYLEFADEEKVSVPAPRNFLTKGFSVTKKTQGQDDVTVYSLDGSFRTEFTNTVLAMRAKANIGGEWELRPG